MPEPGNQENPERDDRTRRRGSVRQARQGREQEREALAGDEPEQEEHNGLEREDQGDNGGEPEISPEESAGGFTQALEEELVELRRREKEEQAQEFRKTEELAQEYVGLEVQKEIGMQPSYRAISRRIADLDGEQSRRFHSLVGARLAELGIVDVSDRRSNLEGIRSIRILEEPITDQESMANQEQSEQGPEAERKRELEILAARLVRAREARQRGERGSAQQLEEIAGEINALDSDEDKESTMDLAKDPDYQSKVLEASTINQEQDMPRRRSPEDEPVEFTPESTPWEKVRQEEEERLVEQYEKQAEFGSELARSAGKELREELDEAQMEYARDWYKDHRDELKEKGIYVQDAEDAIMFKTMQEQGGFEELRTDDKWEKYNLQVENISFLQSQLSDDRVSIEGRFLLLNKFHKRRKI